MSNKFEQQRYDGWYNNLAHPEWGSIESHLTRKTPPSYSDGVYQMSGTGRPSPRKLSQSFMKGKDGLASLWNRTALGTFFGQVNRIFIFLSSFSSGQVILVFIFLSSFSSFEFRTGEHYLYIPVLLL